MRHFNKGKAMIRRALLAVSLLSCGMTGAVQAQDKIILWVDPDGSTYLKNNGATETIWIDGYTIASEHNDLIWQDYDGTKGWKALEDLRQNPSNFPFYWETNPGALTFGSANPGPGNLSELSLSSTGLRLDAGDQWFIGKPFTINPFGAGLAGYAFAFKTTDVVNQQIGAIVPEPSAQLLATLAGLGLVAMQRRGLRFAAHRPK